MTNIVVAYHVPHNEGVEYGIFDKAGQSTELTLVDLYEVDGKIRTFEKVEEAREWLLTYDGVSGIIESNRLYNLNYER